jgi:hypothetical protein
MSTLTNRQLADAVGVDRSLRSLITRAVTTDIPSARPPLCAVSRLGAGQQPFAVATRRRDRFWVCEVERVGAADASEVFLEFLQECRGRVSVGVFSGGIDRRTLRCFYELLAMDRLRIAADCALFSQDFGELPDAEGLARGAAYATYLLRTLQRPALGKMVTESGERWQVLLL